MTSTVWTRITDVATLEPVMVPPETSLRAVTEAMARHDIGAVLVGTPHRPLGVVSERDIVAVIARGANPDEVRAAAVMSHDLVALRPDDAVYDAAVDMLDLGIRHIAVLDEHGTAVGMVSVRDLLRPLVVSALEHAPY
jgi:signal-transduction protein with cAMP-binding, CBS, and nucleotidyltransferase domain